MLINEKKLGNAVIDRLWERGKDINVCERLFHRIDLLIGKFGESESRELLSCLIKNLAEGFGRGLAEGAVEAYKKK